MGVIGLGRIGLYHARILQGHPDLDRLVVTDVDPERTRVAARELEAEPVAGVDELLGRGVARIARLGQAFQANRF